MDAVKKAVELKNKIKLYWKTPMKGRYMPFKEITAYSIGGIGAYFIVTMGSACILSTSNLLVTSTLGVNATHTYIMYLIAVIASIPTTAIRANIIDNTRNKEGKYRPYIMSMGVPTAIIAVLFVWFPYDSLGNSLFGTERIFGETKAYVFKCAMILLFNLLLNFFFYFFNDAYENMIHVLSPNTQERADVTSIKSVVYSAAPSIVNFITPIIASKIFHSNTTDIRVYRVLYPILAVLGMLLCIYLFANTQEKIVKARTHVQQIKFIDAFKAVAKNKYFWIISLAGWIGFLEGSYANILNWLYNYGGVCSGTVFGIIVTISGNASLWGMLAAPFAVRKFGKKKVLVFTNILNIVFIMMMLPFTNELKGSTIWLVLLCLYLNQLFGSFQIILNPAIQADIRDYQQYITGERIDGMFATVGLVGTIITLATSGILPAVYEQFGITKANAIAVTSNPQILNRMLGDGQTVGQILNAQLASGQNNFNNAFSALYDPNLLINVLHVLIILSAVGALLNVIPYFWYDFTERKQKSVIKVLKVRALFEDYGNGVLKDNDLVEAIEIINDSRKMSTEQPIKPSKETYKNKKGDERKQAKKKYKSDLEFDENIEISKFVCDELDKFTSPLMIREVNFSRKIFDMGLDGIANMSKKDANKMIDDAKKLSKETVDDKKYRTFCIEQSKQIRFAVKSIKKYYPNIDNFVKPDYKKLEDLYNEEDRLDIEIHALSKQLKSKNNNLTDDEKNALKEKISLLVSQMKQAEKNSKAESEIYVRFSRCAKPYMDAQRMLVQQENYSKFDDINALYEETKKRLEQGDTSRTLGDATRANTCNT